MIIGALSKKLATYIMLSFPFSIRNKERHHEAQVEAENGETCVKAKAGLVLVGI